ncbi:MAG: SpoIIE family protein phosphatase [Bacteroidetes bacterium]|nr:SpoIIE family protein phosphatase [Bacteroidota bacterium]
MDFQSVDKKIDHHSTSANLSTILEFGTQINSSRIPEFVLNNILFTCLAKFLVSKGAIYLFNKKNLFLRASKGIAIEKIDQEIKIHSKSSKQKLKDSAEIARIKTKYDFQIVELIHTSDQELGILFLGKKLNGAEFNEDDVYLLQAILNISAPAIENSNFIDELKIVNQELKSKVTQIRALFEMSKEFSLLLDAKNVSKLLSYTIMGNLLVKRYTFLYKQKNMMKVLDTNFSEGSFGTDDQLDEIGQKLDEYNILTSTRADEFKEEISKSLSQIEIDLVVPMQIKNETIGLILLGRKSSGEDYSENDMEFLESLGSVAMVSLENARLFKEAIEKQKMEEDLAIGKEIQQNLFPKVIPKSIVYDISALNISSKQVGGDYYDVFRLNDKEILILIADVSGKGVGASLLMANLQAFIKSLTKFEFDLCSLTSKVNDLLVENLTPGKFITFFWGILNEDTRTIKYVNAGHNPPLLVRDKKITGLDKGGMILGVMKSLQNYNCETVPLEEGDIICLFTDGVTEAKNSTDEEYSEERLYEKILDNINCDPKTIIEKITGDLKEFSSQVEQSDDITLLIVRVNS